MINNKKFIFSSKFVGVPSAENFTFVEEPLPELKDGDIQTEALYLSVDPYMRAMSENFPPGQTMIGSQVARVMRSKNSEYKVGDCVVGQFGWQTHFTGNPSDVGLPRYGKFKPSVLPVIPKIPKSYSLGLLGATGLSAYFGFLEICKPKENDVVVVNAAAGAVGSVVGQIAKIKGCKVIGFAGSDEKIDWLKNELGFDFAFNYKKISVSDALKQAAPDGVDCFFDNVGGEMSMAVLAVMKQFGRISVCGSISNYNEEIKKPAAVELTTILFKQLSIEGFIVSRWYDKFPVGIKQLVQWLTEGKIKTKEHLFEGFENMPKAFASLFSGENIGKVVVRV